MTARSAPVLILVAEDDLDDREFTQDAFEEVHANELHFVDDGQQLIDYLTHSNGYMPETAPRPGLILLDLNMPKKDGREALAEIKSNPDLRSIPVIVLTTSKDQDDIYRSYQLGAASYITKPPTFEGLVQAVKTIRDYWFELVSIPEGPGSR